MKYARYVYPVLQDGRILTICGNDVRAYRAMTRAAAGFGGNPSRPAYFPRPEEEAKRGHGETVASMFVLRHSNPTRLEFSVQRWSISQDRYTNGERVSTL